MKTCSAACRGLALALATAVSVIGTPLPASAAGDELPAGAPHHALTLGGLPLSQFAGATAVLGSRVLRVGLSEQGSGQIRGVALDAAGQPLADCAVGLRVVSDQGVAATSVVARTTTNERGVFSFAGLGQGRYIVDLRSDDQVVVTSGVILLADGSTMFTRVGGVPAQRFATDDRKGRGAAFWMAVGAGVGAVGFAASGGLDGIVKLSEIGLTDPLHTRLTTGLSPSSWGSTSRVFVNLTIPFWGP